MFTFLKWCPADTVAFIVLVLLLRQQREFNFDGGAHNIKERLQQSNVSPQKQCPSYSRQATDCKHFINTTLVQLNPHQHR